VSDFALVAPLGGVVVLVFLYLRRVGEPAAEPWAWAWVALYAAGIASTLPPSAALLHAAGNFVGAQFAPLLLAGALALSGGRVPRWVIAAGLAIGLTRATVALLVSPQASHAVAMGVETPFGVAAAWVAWRGARRPGAPTSERWLGGALALIAAVALWDSAVRARGGDTGPMLMAWIASSVLIAFVQVVVALERTRERERRSETAREAEAERRASDLDLLRVIAEAGLTQADVHAAVGAALRALRERLALDGGGVWVLDARGEKLECAGVFGLARPLPPTFEAVPARAPLPRLVLSSPEPILVEDFATDPRITNPRVRAIGEGTTAFFVALRASGADTGMLLAARRLPDRFDRAETALVRAAAGELALTLAHVRGIEQRQRQARDLDAERRRLRALIETAPLGIVLTDADGRLAMLNRAAADQIGIGAPEPWLGRAAGELLHEIRPRLRGADTLIPRLPRLGADADAGASLADVVFRITSSAGERTLVLSSSAVASEANEALGRVWLSRDVTEERRLEEELRQSQKLETIGRLAGGIAHDFNNQLTAILGNARLAREDVPAGTLVESALLDLERAAGHCADLTKALLAFARRAPVVLRAVDPEHALREVEALLRPTLSGGVRLRVAIAPDLPAVQADPTQLQQVLLNLALNARDALHGSGRIELSAERHGGARPGAPAEAATDWVVFCVRDDGVGMDEGTRARIFDPFFTTKPIGEGTGLGLSVVHGVVESHGGWIDVESGPGAGSVFRVYLPTASRGAEPAVAGVAPSDATQGAGETVLVAEDEPSVRRFLRSALEKLGYRVIEARDGVEAREVFAARGHEVDVVLLDFTMPRRGGLDALADIRSLRPDVPAILASGHFGSEAPPSGLPGVELLPKPFTRDALAGCMRAALARRAPQPASA
jgi:signal transduction histidine kinase